jgi:hypothetical protein
MKMARRPLFAALVLGFGLTGCAEFDGFYDDDSDLVMRRGDWSERDSGTENRETDRSGAYGGSEIRR